MGLGGLRPAGLIRIYLMVTLAITVLAWPRFQEAKFDLARWLLKLSNVRFSGSGLIGFQASFGGPTSFHLPGLYHEIGVQKWLTNLKFSRAYEP